MLHHVEGKRLLILVGRNTAAMRLWVGKRSLECLSLSGAAREDGLRKRPDGGSEAEFSSSAEGDTKLAWCVVVEEFRRRDDRD